MKFRVLYRAGNSDVLTGPTAFATTKASALAYLGAPTGFGGDTLYSTRISYEPSEVLDVRDQSDDRQLRAIVDAAGQDEPGAITADAFVMGDRVADALSAQGLRWVRLLDTYPEYSETWVWLGAGDDPELEEIEP